MRGFTLLWEKILRSSIWVVESKETRLVWITILALKDKDGNIFSSVIGLADSAKVSLDECKEALRILTSPDPNDTSKVENGIRLKEIPGGWHIVNHQLYRYSDAERRMVWAEAQANYRAGKKRTKGTRISPKQAENDAREKRYIAAENSGDQEAADNIAAEGLPEGGE